MVISRGRKYIFYRIPRTATRSIATWLVDFCGGSNAAHQHATRAPRRLDLRKYFCFTVVRHPLDRLVSIYHYWAGAEVIHSGCSFEEFVQQFVNHNIQQYSLELGRKRWYKRYGRRDPWPGYIGQKEFIEKTPDPMLRLLRFERLREELCDLPFISNAEVDHLENRDPSPRYQNLAGYYRNEATLRLAIDCCEVDMAFLGYRVQDVLPGAKAS